MSPQPDGPDGRPDWRDPEQYRHPLDLDRAGWAWEWLRRNPDYPRHVPAAPQDLQRVASFEPIASLRPASPGEVARWGLSFRGGWHPVGPWRAAALGRHLR